MLTCRCLVNSPSSQGGIGDLFNFKLPPSLTLGCGSWGGNSVSENVGIDHLLNVKIVACRRENML
jgi:acetaldehyde dehydrogenase/alcohol dehydrogenase